MKIFRTMTAAGIDSLQLEEVAMPGALVAGQIRIGMRAASINYRDTMAVSGQLGPAGPDGLIPGSDGAGEVLEIAADVTRFQVGDRVALTFNPDWIGGPWQPSAAARGRGSIIAGVMQEEMVVHQNDAVLIPAHLSYEEGAALPCAGVTAWHALCGPAPLMPGMSVLLQGAGGVSVLGLQLAKLFGARVIMTSSSPERCARLKELGADEVIDYRAEPAWDQAVRELTGGEGVDVGIDIGGASTIQQTIASTRRGGRVAVVGLLGGWPESVTSLFSAGVSFDSIKVGRRDDFEMMNRAIAFHKMKPVIDRSFAFEELPQALHYLKTGKQFGKIVIRISS
jgi:NADPH:quinone reductase-like Zn-dependent oxidoreductase